MKTIEGSDIRRHLLVPDFIRNSLQSVHEANDTQLHCIIESAIDETRYLEIRTYLVRDSNSIGVRFMEHIPRLRAQEIVPNIINPIGTENTSIIM